MRYRQENRPALRYWALGLASVGLLWAAGCASDGAVPRAAAPPAAIPAAQAVSGGSRFVLYVQPESFIDQGRAAGFRLDLRADGGELLAAVSVQQARGLKALYARLDYDADNWHAVDCKVLPGFGAAEQVLSLGIFTEPGIAYAGTVLRRWAEQPGFAGDGAILQLRFARGRAQAVRRASMPPVTLLSRAVLRWDAQAQELGWYYYNQGDYNQNSRVDISDLTSLAANFGESVAPARFAEPDIRFQVDGNADGTIDMKDLTPIGANWGRSASGGYHVYYSTDSADYPTDPTAPLNPSLLLDTVAFNSASGTPQQHKYFAYAPDAPAAEGYYWVRPFDGKEDGIASTLCEVTTAARGDWWMFGHDISHTHRSPFTGPHTATLAWKFEAGGPWAGNPVLAEDGTVYAAAQDGVLYALAPDGTLQWTFAGETIIWASAAVTQDGTVLQPIGDTLYALSPAGAKLWEFQAQDRIDSSPALDAQGRIYFGSTDKNVYALEPDGTQVWAYTTGGDLSMSSPALGPDGTVYIGSAYDPADFITIDGTLYAIKPDGTLNWATPTGAVIWSSPTLAPDGTVYFGAVTGFMSGAVAALNPDGTLKWAYNVEGEVQGSPALAEDGTVYIGDRGSNLYAFTPDGELKWQNGYGGAGSPCIGGDGMIYVGGFTKYGIYAIDPATGALVWELPTGQSVVGSPSLAPDGTLYVGCSDFFLYAVRDP